MHVSVIICSHNPRRDYLERTLSSLKEQDFPVGNWELIIVDNGSKEGISDAFDIKWHPSGRHVREDQLGLTHARLRGITESVGDLLIFVDDDNVLASDYISKALEICHELPSVAVFGSGSLIPEFEMNPPPEILVRCSMLALRTVDHPIWTNNFADHTAIPWGAGLCVRRSIAQSYPRTLESLQINSVLDRQGNKLFCGGDDLFSWAAAYGGTGFGIFPQLRIKHLIGKGRLTRQYFVRLIHDHSYSHSILRFVLTRVEPAPVTLTRLIRLVFHAMRRGSFSSKCQWAEMRGAHTAGKHISRNLIATPLAAHLLGESGSRA